MRKNRLILFLLMLASCKHKSIEFYKRSFKENKAEYLLIREKVNNLLIVKDSLFKFMIGVTGKRFTEDPYINDTTIFRFYGVHLTEDTKSELAGIMYHLNLENVCVYRDSAQYIYAGRYKDTLVIYNNSIAERASGHLIDVNSYVFFDEQ